MLNSVVLKINVLSILITICSFGESISQSISEEIKNGSVERFIFSKDTFYIINTHQSSFTTEFNNKIETSFGNAYLYRLKNNRLSTLISMRSDYNYDADYECQFSDTSDVIHDYLVDSILNRMDEEYALGSNIEEHNSYEASYLGNGLVHIEYATWAYYGGAHGAGLNEYEYFDLKTNQYFTYEELFNESSYELLKTRIRKEFPDWEPKEDSFELPNEDRVLAKSNYSFEQDSLSIHCQMYDQLLGLYIGYNYYGFRLSYEEMEKYINFECKDIFDRLKQLSLIR